MGCKEMNISVIGSAGGAARAVLSLLSRTITDPGDPLHAIMNQSKLHVIDLYQKNLEYYKQICANLVDRIVLHQFDLQDLQRVRKHIIDTETSLIIDVSCADTIDMLGICHDLGVSYVNSALNVELPEVNSYEGFTIIERYERFEQVRDRFTNGRAIICSGMNPGVVQWMAHSMMEAYRDETPIACYIVETDNTFFKDKSRVRSNTIYASWSPTLFLDEAIANYPMFVKQHEPLYLYSPVYAQEFKVTLGSIQFYGCLMPHEEVLTLGKLYNMETGFLYKVSEHTTQIIRDHLKQPGVLWEWHHQVFDPAQAELEGQDLVGVLLVYKEKERFMYNVTDSQTASKEYGTNATYLQVACGIYAAVCTLLLESIPNGVYYVDELLKAVKGTGYGSYLSRYMTEFVIGENVHSDGLMLDRIKKLSS